MKSRPKLFSGDTERSGYLLNGPPLGSALPGEHHRDRRLADTDDLGQLNLSHLLLLEESREPLCERGFLVIQSVQSRLSRTMSLQRLGDLQIDPQRLAIAGREKGLPDGRDRSL